MTPWVTCVSGGAPEAEATASYDARLNITLPPCLGLVAIAAHNTNTSSHMDESP
jgi:hypothetical protein